MKKNNKKSFLAEQYSKNWEFLKENYDYVLVALGIFCVFIIIGFAFPVFFQEEIIEFIKQISAELEGKSVFGLMWFIFWNNIRSSFFAIVLGAGVCIFPVFAAVFNGYLIGFISRFAVNSSGIFVLWRLAPHGIFELPAIFLAIGLGIKMGVNVFSKKGRKRFKRDFKESMRFFVFVILPLLVLAAVIEGFLVFYIG